MFANESSPVEWTTEAKKHYRVAVGAEGDGRYLRLWHGREGTMRWSTSESQLRLPVLAGEPYTLTLNLNVPKAALSEEAGLYLDGKTNRFVRGRRTDPDRSNCRRPGMSRSF